RVVGAGGAGGDRERRRAGGRRHGQHRVGKDVGDRDRDRGGGGPGQRVAGAEGHVVGGGADHRRGRRPGQRAGRLAGVGREHRVAARGQTREARGERGDRLAVGIRRGHVDRDRGVLVHRDRRRRGDHRRTIVVGHRQRGGGGAGQPVEGG